MATTTLPDILVPEFDSPHRKSSLVPATFNLTATIIGGGVLSLPWAFSKCGILSGSLLMVVGAILTERSLFLLCLTARISGASSYGEVGKVAFGKYMEHFISLLLFIFLVFVLVAYMVLLKDIWTSLIPNHLSFFRHEISHDADGNRPVASSAGDYVLLAIVLLMAPFLFQRTLHSLRFNCYVGFGSVSCLCFAFCHHALVAVTTKSKTPTPNVPQDSLLLWSTSFADVLSAFPIITLSFISIFNVLPIQRALVKPSKLRMLYVIDGAVGSSFVVMLLFAISGYIYAGRFTDGDILNNIMQNDDDWIFFLGRLGCGITIMLAMPMMLLPCRESFLEVLDVCINGPHHVPIHDDEETSLLAKDEEKSTLLGQGKLGNNYATCNDEPSQKPTTIDRPSIRNNTIVLKGATIGITLMCYLAAIRVPGVEVVWGFCGSFMAYLIGFILPSACYLKIQHDHSRTMTMVSGTNSSWILFSWTLLVASIIASIACTVQNISQL